MRQGCNFIQIGESSAIICGGEPRDHECDSNGPIQYEFSDGFVGTLFEKAKKEKLNLNMCDDDKKHFLYEKGITIRSGSVTCSVCERAEINNAYYL